MANRMNREYFEEKREKAQEQLGYSVIETQKALDLIKTLNYSIPGLIDPDQVHEKLKYAAGLLKNARYDFEKACWAGEKTDLEFEDWLRQRNYCEDLV